MNTVQHLVAIAATAVAVVGAMKYNEAADATRQAERAALASCVEAERSGGHWKFGDDTYREIDYHLRDHWEQECRK